MSESNEICSFCGKSKAEVEGMISGMAATICAPCLRAARLSSAHAAYCSSCTVHDGEHAPECPEGGYLAEEGEKA